MQLHGRTKSLFSAMRKILRLGDMASGGRQLAQLHDLLGLRAVVQPRTDLPEAEARLAAIEVKHLLNTQLLQTLHTLGLRPMVQLRQRHRAHLPTIELSQQQLLRHGHTQA